jgi:hypothetical protein
MAETGRVLMPNVASIPRVSIRETNLIRSTPEYFSYEANIPCSRADPSK